ncbi:MAG: hypothetical protein H7249_05660 [Chitinophagaceae bacterium]|nr:hypothetical protein [Oligoflexus sp.]
MIWLGFETYLNLIHYTNFIQFTFFVPALTIFAYLIGGMRYGATVNILASLIVNGLVRYHSTAQLFPGIEVEHQRFAINFLTYSLGAQILVPTIIFLFQDMVGKSDNETQRLKVEKTNAINRAAIASSIGQFAHDINNPLAIIDGSLKILRIHLNSAATSRIPSALSQMDEAQKRLQSVIHELEVNSQNS